MEEDEGSRGGSYAAPMRKVLSLADLALASHLPTASAGHRTDASGAQSSSELHAARGGGRGGSIDEEEEARAPPPNFSLMLPSMTINHRSEGFRSRASQRGVCM